MNEIKNPGSETRIPRREKLNPQEHHEALQSIYKICKTYNLTIRQSKELLSDAIMEFDEFIPWN